jgi:autotransporter-associated beta strand protein
MLLATSALASAALPATLAHADDAVWNPVVDNNFDDNGNWTDGNGVVPTGTATFNASNTRDITFSQGTTLGGIAVTSGAGDYTFDTNQHVVTFNGAGLSVGSGASLKFTSGGNIIFQNKSTAGQAQIAVSAGAFLDFAGNGVGNDNSSAANAKITTSGDVVFQNASTAANASITIDAGGTVFFADQSTGGNASVTLLSNGLLANGALDISGLFTTSGTASGTTVGSIDGRGDIFLGGNTLTVGGNDRTTTFDGAIRDGGFSGHTRGSLTKVGTGALTLTGNNNHYTGATTVNGGALIVDGDITFSSFVTVNAGGTLGGNGFVSTTTINDGGTLAPGHSDNPGSAIGVIGDLTFAPGATYLVQASSARANFTAVDGTATLGGVTVAANFAPGATVTKQHDSILFASSGVFGKFNSVVKTNLSPIFAVSLSYDTLTDVFLNVDIASPSALSGLNANQRNVGNALINAFHLAGGSLSGAFATLTPAGFTQVSGETAVGTQQATFDAMNQFMGVLLDPTVGALSGGRTKDAFAAMPGKAAPLAAEAFNARWGVWAAGFGGSQSVSGDAVLGSNKTTSNVFGSAAGAEYRFSPNTVAGFALAGGGTNFRVANGGSGSSDLFQAGAYLRHTQGAAFIAAALAYGWQDVTTNRTVTVAGIDNLRGRFNSNAISGRLEGGYKVATQAGEFTPYAAGQFTTYRLPSYTEQVASGANTFALAYNGKDVTATRSELGLRSEKAVALTDATLMLRGRLAWAHDFNTDRNVQAAFLTLPGSAFVVNGAQPAADTALTTASAEMLWRSGWSAAVTADAQLSDTTHSYSGKGVVRYNW